MILRGALPSVVDSIVCAYSDGRLDDTTEFVAEIIPAPEVRRHRQLSLYWIWVKEISTQTGYSYKAVDEYLRDELMFRRVCFDGKDVVEIVPRCSDPRLSVGEMADFMERVTEWARSNLSVELRAKAKGARVQLEEPFSQSGLVLDSI